MALSLYSYGQQVKDISAGDRYLILSARALEGMKKQFPLTIQKELAIKRLSNDFLIQVASIESAGLAGKENPAHEYERQLQDLFNKEEYTAYRGARDKLIINLAHQRAASAKRSPENSKSISMKETRIMKERYKLTKEQEQAVILVNDIYFKEMTAPITEKDPEVVKQKRIAAKEIREQQLQTLFSSEQYAAFRKDIEAIESDAQKQQIVIKQALEAQKQRRNNKERPWKNKYISKK